MHPFRQNANPCTQRLLVQVVPKMFEFGLVAATGFDMMAPSCSAVLVGVVNGLEGESYE